MASRRADGNPLQALFVTMAVAVACALLVSFSAVTLRPYYLANLEAERQAQLASILGALSQTMGEITAKDLQTHVVELDTGNYTDKVDAATFNLRRTLADPRQSIAIPTDDDLAGIKRRANVAVVFVLRDPAAAIQALILPVYGSGYQSTLYGFLALSADTSSVLALKFYEQGDTPGIGARIQEAEWEALWPGKKVYDENAVLRLGVARGKVVANSEAADYVVDGVSGATRTSLGVNGLLRFWLGDFGFGPYLERLRRGED